MTTTHYAQKNVLYYKNSTLQVKICRLLTVWRKQWMIQSHYCGSARYVDIYETDVQMGGEGGCLLQILAVSNRYNK